MAPAPYESTSITPRTQGVAVPVNGGFVYTPPQNGANFVVGQVNDVTNSAAVILTISYSYDDNHTPSQHTDNEQEFKVFLALDSTLSLQANASDQVAQSVTRFAINPHCIAGITPAQANQVLQSIQTVQNNQVHNVEYFVLLQALGQLNQVNDVVVMDIFAINNNATIKLQAVNVNGQHVNVPEIHSVVLWRESQNNIILIDPNNRAFSERLQSAYASLNIANAPIMLLGAMPSPRIYNPGQNPTGYNDTGSDMARDCIDIAVKIAFEIQVVTTLQQNAQNPRSFPQPQGQLAPSQESEIYQVITNQSHINRNMLNGTLFRGIQSSVAGIRWMSLMIGLETMQSVVVAMALARVNEEILRATQAAHPAQKIVQTTIQSVRAVAQALQALQVGQAQQTPIAQSVALAVRGGIANILQIVLGQPAQQIQAQQAQQVRIALQAVSASMQQVIADAQVIIQAAPSTPALQTATQSVTQSEQAVGQVYQGLQAQIAAKKRIEILLLLQKAVKALEEVIKNI